MLFSNITNCGKVRCFKVLRVNKPVSKGISYRKNIANSSTFQRISLLLGILWWLRWPEKKAEFFYDLIGKISTAWSNVLSKEIALKLIINHYFILLCIISKWFISAFMAPFCFQFLRGHCTIHLIEFDFLRSTSCVI